MFKAKVTVTLKPEILDVQGRTISESLQHLEINDVSEMRVGKYFEFNIDSSNEDTAKAEVNKLSDQLLANPVIEDYEVELIGLSA